MPPHSYELSAGLVLFLGGALACFAGHRLLKVVLGIYGFVIGAKLASSMLVASTMTGMVVGEVAGGVAGAITLVVASFIGIALVGAGLGALVAEVGSAYAAIGDPPVPAVIVLAVVGAIGAMLLKRYVIIVSTAFGGAWTLLLGVLAWAGDLASARASSDLWILYPMTPGPEQRWVPVAWVLLGLIGTAVQLGATARKK